MDDKRPDGAVSDIATLRSKVPVSPNKPLYPSLDFDFPSRCDVIGDIFYDIPVNVLLYE